MHVPAFIVDFTPDYRYLGEPGKLYSGLFHVSDWLPTLSRYANISTSLMPANIDGLDQSESMKQNLSSPRTEIVFDLIDPEDSFFSEGMISFRYGDIKIIDGLVRDTHWYSESSHYFMNSTDETWISIVGEMALRVAEFFFSDSKFDTAHHILAHGLVMHAFSNHDEILIYNVTQDPGEKFNLRESHPEILKDMLKRVEELLLTAVPQQPIWLILKHEEYRKSWAPGDCSMNPLIASDECLFLHTWAADDVEPLSYSDKFASGRTHVTMLAKAVIKMFIIGIFWMLFLVFISVFLCARMSWKLNKNVVSGETIRVGKLKIQ